MKPPIITATTPYGQLKRATLRKYTHVVALTEPKLEALSWCGSAKLAESQLRYWTANGGKNLKQRHKIADKWEVQIFPIDIQEQSGPSGGAVKAAR